MQQKQSHQWKFCNPIHNSSYQREMCRRVASSEKQKQSVAGCRNFEHGGWCPRNNASMPRGSFSTPNLSSEGNNNSQWKYQIARSTQTAITLTEPLPSTDIKEEEHRSISQQSYTTICKIKTEKPAVKERNSYSMMHRRKTLKLSTSTPILQSTKTKAPIRAKTNLMEINMETLCSPDVKRRLYSSTEVDQSRCSSISSVNIRSSNTHAIVCGSPAMARMAGGEAIGGVPLEHKSGSININLTMDRNGVDCDERNSIECESPSNHFNMESYLQNYCSSENESQRDYSPAFQSSAIDCNSNQFNGNPNQAALDHFDQVEIGAGQSKLINNPSQLRSDQEARQSRRFLLSPRTPKHKQSYLCSPDSIHSYSTNAHSSEYHTPMFQSNFSNRTTYSTFKSAQSFLHSTNIVEIDQRLDSATPTFVKLKDWSRAVDSRLPNGKISRIPQASWRPVHSIPSLSLAEEMRFRTSCSDIHPRSFRFSKYHRKFIDSVVPDEIRQLPLKWLRQTQSDTESP